MRLYRAKDYNDMSRKAANIISAQIILKPDCVLGLATGSTPIGTYQQLIERYREGDLDFSQVRTANLDEYRGLTRDNDQSYYYFMYHNLFKEVNIDMANTNIPDGTNPDSAAEAARYDQVIRDLGGVDLQLLGMGHNGHIGFNEPGTPFDSHTHVVELKEGTRRDNARFFDNDINKVPTHAVTLGLKDIMNAKFIILLASGSGKADAVKKMIKGTVDESCPASVLQTHPNVLVVADEAAAYYLN